MTVLQILFIMLGILLGIVLLCLGVIYLEKKAPTKNYDERQLSARARAHRLSFWVGYAYFLAVVIILMGQIDGEKKVEPFLLVFAGLILQALVLHTYSILSDAALPLSERPLYPITCFTFVGCLQLIQFCNQLRWGIPGLTGRGAADWVFLMTGISFLYLSLLHLIQWLRGRKE